MDLWNGMDRYSIRSNAKKSITLSMRLGNPFLTLEYVRKIRFHSDDIYSSFAITYCDSVLLAYTSNMHTSYQKILLYRVYI